tara:strand:+ start:344 stop:826 length:483 start_codon:yes stop_codon:yes gene_type:complete
MRTTARNNALFDRESPQEKWPRKKKPIDGKSPNQPTKPPRKLAQAHKKNESVRGTVESLNKGGWVVTLVNGFRGFCPFSQTKSLQPQIARSKSMIGKSANFAIIKFEPGSAIVSFQSFTDTVYAPEPKRGRQKKTKPHTSSASEEKWKGVLSAMWSGKDT